MYPYPTPSIAALHRKSDFIEFWDKAIIQAIWLGLWGWKEANESMNARNATLEAGRLGSRFSPQGSGGTAAADALETDLEFLASRTVREIHVLLSLSP